MRKRRDGVPDPEYVVGPDGRLTPESIASIERAAVAGDVEAMANHGTTLFQRGEHAEAVRFWERAWDAGNAAAGFNLGTHYAMLGETNRAEVIWQRSAALGDVDAVVGLVRLALERRDYTAASTWVPRVLNSGVPFAMTAIALAFRDFGDESTAVKALTAAIKLGYAPAFDHAAAIFDRNGRHSEATRLRARAQEICGSAQ
jgi:TPR repeat protein